MEPFIVEHDSPLTKWGQIRRDLRARIENGEYRAGAKLPTEAELMAHYGVSRATVRRTLAAMTDDGYVVSRRGSGTYVTGRGGAGRFHLDLNRPWRDQLLLAGHDAVSQLGEIRAHAELPAHVAHFFTAEPAPASFVFAREVHLVDGVPIGLTESWTGRTGTLFDDPAVDVANERVTAECYAEIDFATALQAGLLRSYLDVPLIVVTARTRLVTTGQTVEFARTWWLGSRVRLAYQRELTLAQIDVTQLIGRRG
ncbi:GntR family transcriptional regulator [Cryobacterium frigoriphilum]|uniref:GntR family transcriptional regulator n=1 Tax=Cryobacterium frigoriphilum TaxID=1259150 RepID=UPI00141A8F59|nr:GntR family transcriptional regulator [Cryobacterium frigoriphilum]